MTLLAALFALWLFLLVGVFAAVDAIVSAL